jgi:pimeloyl-ACP methyl ester carboxylesterase
VTAFLLVPGAMATGRHWVHVVAALRGLGHEGLAPDLPNGPAADLDACAAAVAAAAGDRRDVAVVGHSLGAFTAPLAADRIGARLLVLVCPMIPAAGESAAAWWETTGWEEARRAAGLPPEPDDDRDFFHDVPPERAAESRRDAERPGPGGMWEDPWPLPAWPDVPTRVLLCRDDRFFPPAFVRRLAAERLGITPDEMDGGHLPALARPEELAARLAALAQT